MTSMQTADRDFNSRSFAQLPLRKEAAGVQLPGHRCTASSLIPAADLEWDDDEAETLPGFDHERHDADLADVPSIGMVP